MLRSPSMPLPRRHLRCQTLNISGSRKEFLARRPCWKPISSLHVMVLQCMHQFHSSYSDPQSLSKHALYWSLAGLYHLVLQRQGLYFDTNAAVLDFALLKKCFAAICRCLITWSMIAWCNFFPLVLERQIFFCFGRGWSSMVQAIKPLRLSDRSPSCLKTPGHLLCSGSIQFFQHNNP